MTAISFTVHGVAAPAGSKRGFTNRKTGRVIITDDSKRSRPWKAQVADAAAEAMNGAPLLDGPLELVVVIYLPRPQSHYRSARQAEATGRPLRPSAPRYPAVRPDTTKYLRAIEDACNGVVWRDDAQIVVQQVAKRYAPGGAYCMVSVDELEPRDAPVARAADKDAA